MAESRRGKKQRTVLNGEPRKEPRVPMAEPVVLSGQDAALSSETTRTQDVSPSGARVLTERVWKPGSHLIIQAVNADFRARARVVYWRSFSSSRFAIGLEFIEQRGTWNHNEEQAKAASATPGAERG